LVARLASCDDVFPTLASALNDWNDVVQGELSFVELLAAVLASVVVSMEDVGPRESDDVLLF
jgi:NAD+--asparagine ADP-ribosyltransferase